MKPFTTERAPRRMPVGRDQYRATARYSGVAPRLELRRPPRAFDAVLLVVALLFVLATAPRISGVFAAGTAEFESRLGELFPALQGSKVIDLPSSGGNVSAEISATLPDFTRDPQVKVAGRVPAFAQGEGRMVEITLNGALLSSVAPDASGTFSTNVDL